MCKCNKINLNFTSVNAKLCVEPGVADQHRCVSLWLLRLQRPAVTFDDSLCDKEAPVLLMKGCVCVTYVVP